ncbi:sensor histidine kinase [Roseomonas marmotae]|uniref:histidine kinase n=1 Tax=Roseomonas marmotae TaxID=2768161 RepID=A0ABS3KF51_9PROT|nr:HAMP domain-containing sensor histidine kinase [Roseomonas marmotae]MBO1076096.1 HAMP domain-containing histidine kinase [Roseomonas marmotae]QTI81332.1 HAMP domain-containing histidine kinase [Roseomonas marmotae]
MASMPRLFRSLTFRLALLSALWVAGGLGLAGYMLLGLINAQLTESFDLRTSALLYKVAGAAALGPDGRPRLDSSVPVPEFEQPLSGYYWQMEAGDLRAMSRSLWDGQIALPGASPHSKAPVIRDGIGPRGEPLRVAERLVTMPESREPIRIRVGLDRRPLDDQIASFRLLILTYFGVIGIGLVAGGTAQLIWGMRPLRQAREALILLRAGQRTSLAHSSAPSEIAPLLEEIDALVRQNHDTVERARSHVGNLAHALKTPLAVQRMALDPGTADTRLAREQNRTMEMLMQHHLSRARGAALAGAAATDASPVEVAREIATALSRIFANKDLELDILGDDALRAKVDRQDLTEIIGNLLENACQWARHQVTLAVGHSSANLLITVTDDGPGVALEDYDTVLARGVRLDEAKPGSGLGLAITRDLVNLYGGSLSLQEAQPAGLMVAVTLPLSLRQEARHAEQRSRGQASA